MTVLYNLYYDYELIASGIDAESIERNGYTGPSYEAIPIAGAEEDESPVTTVDYCQVCGGAGMGCPFCEDGLV